MASDSDAQEFIVVNGAGEDESEMDVSAPTSNNNPTSDREVSISYSATTTTDKQPRSKGGREIEDMLKLPIVRELPWKEGKALDISRSLESPRPQKKGASLLAIRGEVRDPPCSHCAGDYGRFSLCIALPDWFNGACATCQFGSRGNLCTFRNPDTLQNRVRREVKAEKNSKKILNSIPKYPGDSMDPDTEQEEDEQSDPKRPLPEIQMLDVVDTPNQDINGHRKRKRSNDVHEPVNLESPREILQATAAWKPYESPYRPLEPPSGASNPLSRHSLPSTPTLYSSSSTGPPPPLPLAEQHTFRIPGYQKPEERTERRGRPRLPPQQELPDDGPRQYQRIAPQQAQAQLPRLAPISANSRAGNSQSRSPHPNSAHPHSAHPSNTNPNTRHSNTSQPSNGHPNNSQPGSGPNSAHSNNGHPHENPRNSNQQNNNQPNIGYPNSHPNTPGNNHPNNLPNIHLNTQLNTHPNNIQPNDARPESARSNNRNNDAPIHGSQNQRPINDRRHDNHNDNHNNNHPAYARVNNTHSATPSNSIHPPTFPPMKTGFTPVNRINAVDRDATESVSPISQAPQPSLPPHHSPYPPPGTGVLFIQPNRRTTLPVSRPMATPENAIIDSLPRKKQKQIFSIIGGLQSGIRSCVQQAENMQRQLDLLQEAFGIEPDEAEPRK